MRSCRCFSLQNACSFVPSVHICTHKHTHTKALQNIHFGSSLVEYTEPYAFHWKSISQRSQSRDTIPYENNEGSACLWQTDECMLAATQQQTGSYVARHLLLLAITSITSKRQATFFIKPEPSDVAKVSNAGPRQQPDLSLVAFTGRIARKNHFFGCAFMMGHI